MLEQMTSNIKFKTLKNILTQVILSECLQEINRDNVIFHVWNSNKKT